MINSGNLIPKSIVTVQEQGGDYPYNSGGWGPKRKTK